MSLPGPATTRYLLLDGMRGPAAFVIAMNHFTSLSGQREIFGSASLAVELFFCLSGFVIAHAYEPRLAGGMTLTQFLVRRISRLYPMFLAGSMIGAIALWLGRSGAFNSLSPISLAEAALLNGLFLPFPSRDFIRVFDIRLWGVAFPLDPPAWSLFFAIVGSVVYVGVFRLRSAPAVVMVLSALALFWSAFEFGEAPGWSTTNLSGGLPRVLFAFFAGVALHQVRPALAPLARVNAALVPALALALVMVPRFEGHMYYWLFGSVIGVPAVAALAASRASVGMAYGERLCAHSGAISYALFCVHYPLLMLFSIAFPRSVGLPLLAAYLATSLAAAHFLHKHVERPLHGWLAPRLGKAAT